MISLALFQPEHRAALLALQLAPGQEQWTHHPAETLPEVEGNPLRRAVTILEDGVPVGVFILGIDERVEWYAGAPDPQAATLNALCLEERCQGRGIGTQVMGLLPEWVPSVYPQVRRLLLCVHQTNLGAIHVYKKTGWRILRERQGKRGLLWVMERAVSG